jgi:hypothetical protein
MLPFAFREIARALTINRPKVRIANPQISRGIGAQRPGYRPTRVSFTRRFRAVRVRHASIRPNLSRPRGASAQMTSGSGAPKRILSEETITFKLQWPS